MVSFALVMLGLAAVDVLVLLSVVPQLRALRAIASDHGRAVEITTRVRTALALSRGAVVQETWSAPGGVRPGEGTRALVAVERDTDALLPLAETSTERASVAALRGSIASCREEAARIDALVEAGDLAGARVRVEPLLALTRAANEDADRIVTFNAIEVEQLSTGIRRSLRWTVIAATLVTVLGGASATVLLRKALRGLAAEEAATLARSAEWEAFAARAAHELRSPLQTVSLALGALADGRGPRALEAARRGTARLGETIDGLLEFARAGAAGSETGTADLARVVAVVQEELAPHLAAARVALRIDVPPETSVAMPGTLVATVVRNLVGNAVKYAGGTDGARIEVRARATGAGVHAEVTDNGPGIPADALPRVFEPFVRATTRGSGHGLGLATVRRLVEAYGGWVHLASAPGVGTTVSIDLPRAAAAGASHRGAAPLAS